MLAYKLFIQRKNGTLGSLFINRRAVIPVGVWLQAEDIPTSGYAHRPGWHCTAKPSAPHLSPRGRVWYHVEIQEYETMERPASQGGTWYVASFMKVISPAIAEIPKKVL